MPTEPQPIVEAGAVSKLTDGTGVSKITGSKLLKDIVLDFLLALPPALIAINVASLEAATVAPLAVGFAVLDVGFRVVYRALLRWAQTPTTLMPIDEVNRRMGN